MPLPAVKAHPPRAEATYAQLEALPEHMVGEIIDGELVASPRPRSRLAHTTSVVGIDIGGAFFRKPSGPDRPGGWWIVDEPELHFGKQVLVPDLAGWRHARMPEIADVAYFTLAPDWVCEVISPSSARRDRIQKARIYAQSGVSWLWLIDPAHQTVEVMHNNGEHWVVIDNWGGDDDAARIPPFDAVAVDLSRWWLPAPTELP